MFPIDAFFLLNDVFPIIRMCSLTYVIDKHFYEDISVIMKNVDWYMQLALQNYTL